MFEGVIHLPSVLHSDRYNLLSVWQYLWTSLKFFLLLKCLCLVKYLFVDNLSAVEREMLELSRAPHWSYLLRHGCSNIDKYIRFGEKTIIEIIYFPSKPSELFGIKNAGCWNLNRWIRHGWKGFHVVVLLESKLKECTMFNKLCHEIVT